MQAPGLIVKNDVSRPDPLFSTYQVRTKLKVGNEGKGEIKKNEFRERENEETDGWFQD